LVVGCSLLVVGEKLKPEKNNETEKLQKKEKIKS